jgi:hypothetical protein
VIYIMFRELVLLPYLGDWFVIILTIVVLSVTTVGTEPDTFPEDGSTFNSRKVVYIKYTSGNGQCPTIFL